MKDNVKIATKSEENSRTEECELFVPANNKEFKKHHNAPTEYCFVIRFKFMIGEHQATRSVSTSYINIMKYNRLNVIYIVVKYVKNRSK